MQYRASGSIRQLKFIQKRAVMAVSGAKFNGRQNSPTFGTGQYTADDHGQQLQLTLAHYIIECHALFVNANLPCKQLGPIQFGTHSLTYSQLYSYSQVQQFVHSGVKTHTKSQLQAQPQWQLTFDHEHIQEQPSTISRDQCYKYIDWNTALNTQQTHSWTSSYHQSSLVPRHMCEGRLYQSYSLVLGNSTIVIMWWEQTCCYRTIP